MSADKQAKSLQSKFVKYLQPIVQTAYGWHPEKYETNLTLSGKRQLVAIETQATAKAGLAKMLASCFSKDLASIEFAL